MSGECHQNLKLPVPAGTPLSIRISAKIPDSVVPLTAQFQVKAEHGDAVFLVDVAATAITDQGAAPTLANHTIWDLEFDLTEGDTRAIGAEVRRPFAAWVNSEENVVASGKVRCCQKEL